MAIAVCKKCTMRFVLTKTRPNICKECHTEEYKFNARCAKYGITPQRFWDIHKQQDGRCAICKIPGREELHIDHDHDTNKVRGLLCWNCNVGIGHFKDDPTRLYNAHWYLADPPLDKVK